MSLDYVIIVRGDKTMKDIRLLELYDRLLKNEDIDIKKYAEENKVNIRTAERDIKTIRNFLAKKIRQNLYTIQKRKNISYLIQKIV